ncbi:MAG: 4-(cytidine 5'-diphospho)-2-C-methyl-D-erythritol kinase [Ruminococcaceae bacterium]|nr:4-(cytidine 5'-diphospho)-2-C-methyl-D-erythritol kinase [Oscillospiraceae bacterium]
MTVTKFAYAKINLFLDIESRRDDGYHNILSLMQRISLKDTISVYIEPAETKAIKITCSDPTIPCGEKNLAYKAADIYPIPSGKIVINIDKVIPSSAGLAGGSADAAATLLALNELSGDKLTLSELCALGAKLGADIPFCITEGACIVEGIGDILTATDPMPEFPIVIAKKGEGMSTPAAYRALDEKYDNFVGYASHKELLDQLTKVNETTSAHEYCEGLFNIFEDIVEPERPNVTLIKEIMMSCGAASAMMSGSGTSVFGIFDSEISATVAVEALKKQGADAYLCYPHK